jgi:hypothetical protein
MMSKSYPAEKLPELPAIGEAFGGGFLGAVMPAPDGRLWVVVVAPKREGEKESVMWGERNFPVPAARSFIDGFANSEATNSHLFLPAQFCRCVRSGGNNDWYLPSCGELAAIWANLGPLHTLAAKFQKDASEAFGEGWYWSSTEVELEPTFAWGQSFDDKPFGAGAMPHDDKYTPNSCRAVRRVLI